MEVTQACFDVLRRRPAASAKMAFRRGRKVTSMHKTKYLRLWIT